MAALETRIAVLVEEQRHRLDPKAKPLAIDPELARIARARASRHGGQELSRPCRAQWRHPRLAADEGRTPNGRACWAKIWRPSITPGKAAWTVDEFAQRFLDEWLKSPPHRDNMAFADYDHAGVGAAVNGDTVYVALLFSTDWACRRPRTAARPAPSPAI